jgi:hypothetical protein
VSHTSWTAQAAMGESSPYHLDPRPGGAPVLTPDGRWRWDGGRWVLRDDAEVSGEDPAADEDAVASLD